MTYSCEKCGKIFRDKFNYTKHINRKNSCIKTNKNTCSNCGKKFARYGGLKYHTDHNVCIKKSFNNNIKNSPTNTINGGNNNTINNNNNIKNITNIDKQIIVFPFGKEDYNTLFEKDILASCSATLFITKPYIYQI